MILCLKSDTYKHDFLVCINKEFWLNNIFFKISVHMVDCKNFVDYRDFFVLTLLKKRGIVILKVRVSRTLER